MKLSLNVKLGIIAGILNCIAWYVFSKTVVNGYYNIAVDQYRYYVTLLLLLLGIFISIYNERKTLGGCIHFKEALKTGFLYTLVLALFLGVFNFLYYKFIAVDAVEHFLNDARFTMKEAKVKDEDIGKNLEVMKDYFGSFRMFMSTVIMGVILSLLSSAIFRRKNPVVPFSEN